MSARIGIGVVLLGAIACSSHKADSPVPVSLDAPGDPLAPPAPGVVAHNVSLDEVAVFQTLKVSVAKGDNVADRGSPALPIVGGRDAIVRLYVTPGDGWTPHDITARLKITTHTPTGTYSQLFSATKTVDKASTDADMSSTINVPVPGSALLAGATFAVVLNEDKGSPAQASDPARFPRDGSFADLGVSPSGSLVRIMLVPVQYNADGSGRVPETGDLQIKKYSDRFYQLYPTAKIDIQIRDPFPWGTVVSASGAGWPELLMAIGALHSTDNADPDIYYYGAFDAAASFGQFCGGGCIAGLSSVGSPYSIGIGFPGDVTTETAVHEVGHAHGLQHAPCGGAARPDPAFPYGDGSIGVWGLDPLDGKTLYAPSAEKDMMGYCMPTWISDYHYNRIFSRVESDNRLLADVIAGVPSRKYRAVHVAGTGEATWGEWTQSHWPERGERRVATFEGALGEMVAREDAYYFPYDHLPGGLLMVPERAEAFTTVRIADVGVLPRYTR